MYDCRVVNIPCAVGQFIHCAGACHFDCARLNVPRRSIDGDLAARRNLSAGSVYDDFLVSRAEGYFITQSDGVFFSACLCTEPFRNGYIGVFRFDCRRFCRTADGRVQLTQVDCITVCRAVSHVGNLLAVRVETIFVDIGLSVNGQAAIRPKIHIFFQVVFYGRYLSGRIFCHGSRCICSIGKVDFTAVLYLIHIAVVLLYRPGNTACRIGCRRFQLGHIDGIGIIRAGRHIDDLAFYRIRADTDGTCRSFCRINGIYLRCAGTGRNIRIGRSYIPCRRPAGMAVGNTVRAERHAAVHFGIGIRSQNGRILPGSLRRRTHDGGILACPRRCRPDTDSDDMSLIAIIRLGILADYNRGYAFGGGIQADSYAAGIRGRVHTCFLTQSDAAFITAGAAFCTDSQSAVITGTQHFSLVTDGSPFLGTVYGTFRTDSYTALCG